MMRRLRHEEGGWAVVTAVVLLSVMLGSAVTLLTLVDSQTRESQVQRTREASFNLAEALLNDQVMLVRDQWPNATQGAAGAFGTCTGSTGGTRCPAPGAVAGATSSVDAAGGLTWETRVMDNVVREPGCGDTDPATPCDPRSSFYSDQTHAAAPGFDANGDGVVWTRAQATARGRTRRLLALVRSTTQIERIVRAPVLTGSLDFSNNGARKTFVDGGTNGTVYVRCDAGVVSSTPCIGYGAQGNRDTREEIVKAFEGSISPARWSDKYPEPKAMAADALERLRQTAIADGTYYTSCAQIPTIAGDVVWLERISCAFQGNGAYNSAAKPGLLVVNGGALELRGTVTFYGPIYAPNPDNTTATAVTLNGTVSVVGGIIVDGQGRVVIGSSGRSQVQFDESAFDAVRSRTGAGVVQSEFRELPPSATADG